VKNLSFGSSQSICPTNQSSNVACAVPPSVNAGLPQAPNGLTAATRRPVAFEYVGKDCALTYGPAVAKDEPGAVSQCTRRLPLTAVLRT
jgi:hypothetical protein